MTAYWFLLLVGGGSNSCLDSIKSDIESTLAPSGVLRVGINKANKLLVNNDHGKLEGIAPALGKRLAKDLLGSEDKCLFVPYPSPGALANDPDSWDVAFMGVDPKRAQTVAFSDPYVEIPCSFLAPPLTHLQVLVWSSVTKTFPFTTFNL